MVVMLIGAQRANVLDRMFLNSRTFLYAYCRIVVRGLLIQLVPFRPMCHAGSPAGTLEIDFLRQPLSPKGKN